VRLGSPGALLGLPAITVLQQNEAGFVRHRLCAPIATVTDSTSWPSTLEINVPAVGFEALGRIVSEPILHLPSMEIFVMEESRTRPARSRGARLGKVDRPLRRQQNSIDGEVKDWFRDDTPKRFEATAGT